ncbi:WecB/TagA/CpsF family glycosyltransferase [Cupriavidus basilensis]|uniref:WecB/TagA/CpsF family glycosyltransferase n=1 Tax=Cupriavidus basilensis TaxID=68895 RepID=UPI0009DA678C|nr:WecB/TagA/CpsF family glycosyltransferase [Cupriavidus basilensis]
MEETVTNFQVAGLRVSSLAVSEDRFTHALQDAISKSRCIIVTFVNPNSFFLRRKHYAYSTELGEFDAVFADGIGVVLGAGLLGYRIRRLSFDSTSLAPVIFRWAQENSIGTFLIGSSKEKISVAERTISEEFENLKILGKVDGYTENSEAIAKIISSGAQLVICGMGGPLQERFLLNLRDAGFRGVAFTCGGYFDQLIGGYDYYPRIVDKLNVRFIFRLCKEPRRLAKRYLIDSRFFVFDIFKGNFLKKYKAK